MPHLSSVPEDHDAPKRWSTPPTTELWWMPRPGHWQAWRHVHRPLWRQPRWPGFMPLVPRGGTRSAAEHRGCSGSRQTVQGPEHWAQGPREYCCSLSTPSSLVGAALSRGCHIRAEGGEGLELELEGVPAPDYPCEGPFLSQTAQVWVAQHLPW